MSRRDNGRGRPAGRAATRSTLLAPSWAPIVTAVAVVVTGLIAVLVWRSTRLGWLDLWALRAFRADTYLGFRLASAISAMVRLLALGAAAAIAAFAWVALRRRDTVILSLGAPAATLAVEKLLKQLVARQTPGSGVFQYPSGHLAVATALALTLVLVVRLATARPGLTVAVAASATLIVLVVARARLAETAHSLSDVVGGITTGVAVTLAAALLLDARPLRVVRNQRPR
jgi:membrane-associated phospholipid phosphatase